MIKKFFAVFGALALLGSIANAQTPTPTFSPVPVGAVTPVPIAGVTEVGRVQASTHHYVIRLSAITALGAATSGNIPIVTIPANSVIDQVMWKHSVAVAGGSISASTARVTTTNNNYSNAALDVFAAVSNSGLKTDFTPKAETYAAATIVNLAMTSTSDNLSSATAGQIDVWISYRTLGLTQ